MTAVGATALAVIIIVLPAPPDPGAAGQPAAPYSAPPPATSSPAQGTTPGLLPGAAGTLGSAAAGLGQAGSGLGQAVGGTADGLGATASGAGQAVGGLARGADLAGWKLSVPVKNGKGSATSVSPGQGDTGPWMTKAQDGSLKFWAPVHGSTTPNSTHTRTELDSLHNFTAGSGRHGLQATVSVEQVPSTKPDIIVGQIHGADTISSSSFVMLHYDAGLIRITVKHGTTGTDNDQHQLLSGIPLGAKFSYQLSDNGDGTVSFAVTYNGQTKSDSAAIPAGFKGQPVRFQAGDYQQATSTGGDSGDSKGTDGSTGSDSSTDSAAANGSGEDGGRVTFYSLTEDHSTASPSTATGEKQ